MSYYPFLDPEKIIPISRSTTEVFKTGSWSRSRPLFEEKFSPCRAACPTANNIAGALHRVSEGDYDGALAAFLEESPLPGVCGRVCNHACQGRCNRGDHDGSVGIRALERAAADLGTANPEALTDAGKGHPVAVIGSGPAGLAAAYHLARMGHPVTLIEARERLGGLLTWGIPAYRLPEEVLKRDLDRIISLGIQVKSGQPVDAKGLKELLSTHEAVLAATGAWAPNALGIPGEALQGVCAGLDFLLDGALQAGVKGRQVVVIGGGNTAIDAARVALRRGAAQVSILYRPDLDPLPTTDEEVREAFDEGISRFSAHPLQFLEENGRVRGVRCQERPLAEAVGGELPGSPQDLGSGNEVPAELIITAIGQSVEESSLYGGLRGDGGRIAVDRQGRTARAGLYLAGDAGSMKATVVDALATGKRAAVTIHADLAGYDPLAGKALSERSAGFSIKALFQPQPGPTPDRLAEVNPFSYLTAASVAASVQTSLPPKLRAEGFDEVVKGFGERDAQSEASRCFYCGSCIGCDLCATFCPDASLGNEGKQTAYACNPDYCKGCGACAAVCVRGVLTMGDEQ